MFTLLFEGTNEVNHPSDHCHLILWMVQTLMVMVCRLADCLSPDEDTLRCSDLPLECDPLDCLALGANSGRLVASRMCLAKVHIMINQY